MAVAKIFKKFEYKLNSFESGPNFVAILKSDSIIAKKFDLLSDRYEKKIL